MPFVSKEELGGQVDPNINTKGRPTNKDKPKKTSRRSARDKELLQLARKLKPHISAAIMAAVGVIGDKDASDANKIKAAAFLVDTHRKVLIDLYEGEPTGDEEETPQEVQPQNPSVVLSLKVVENTE